MTWTQFHDMNSGGGKKEPFRHCFIEAPEEQAKVIFYNRFGHSPDRVTCTCCGPDYSLTESESLAQATGYERNCKSLETPRGEDGRFQHPHDEWFKAHYYLEPEDEAEALERGWSVDDRYQYGAYVPLEEYVKNPDVLVIPASEITEGDLEGSVPEAGYVWVGD